MDLGVFYTNCAEKNSTTNLYWEQPSQCTFHRETTKDRYSLWCLYFENILAKTGSKTSVSST